ncbi:ABC transporter permease [Thalassoglobus sp.]|uniref:ABC transporter permease n=1 Tax=Thalassoglobus sp. TaxID=2795869 RepID=UPI003AA9241A
MIRGTLTLLNRSIRGDALKSQAHWVRIASVILLLVFLFFAHFRSSIIGAPGLEFFRSMAYLGIALISLAGVGHFSNSITEEKEEGTLNLLLLADISPLSILLGKSTNRILSVFLIFAAQFPFALLSITLGGITVTQIFTTYLTLSAFLFLIANLALFASVVSRRSGEASGLMVLFTLFLLGLVPAAYRACKELIQLGYLEANGRISSGIESLKLLHDKTSVIDQISLIFEPNSNYAIFSWQVLYSFLLGTLFFLMAWAWFRRIVWLPETVEPSRVTTSKPTRRWTPYVARPWPLALAWKDFYFIGGGPFLVATKMVLFPLWIILCREYSPEIHRYTFASGEQFARDALLIVFAIETLLYSAQFLQSERQLGTLPTLLMLPLSVGQITYQKMFGCLIATVPTVIAILIAEYFLNQKSSRELIIHSRGLFACLCVLIVLCQLTVLCSLISKWGALPLAIGIMLITGTILAPFVAGAMTLISRANQGVLAELSPLIYSTAIVSGAIQFEIARRTRTIAGA